MDYSTKKESKGSKNRDKKIVIIKLKILNKKGEKLRKNKNHHHHQKKVWSIW
jgi:hypothetical protein